MNETKQRKTVEKINKNKKLFEKINAVDNTLAGLSKRQCNQLTLEMEMRLLLPTLQN